MIQVVAIIAGATGAVARYSGSGWVQHRAGARFPFGTALVNLVGAFALGLVAASLEPDSLPFALAGGFLGGFTTFSTWMVETLRLGRRGGERWLGAANLLGLLALGVGAAAAGYRLAA